MEPEPDMQVLDLSPLAPRHDDAVYARIAARGIELRRLRRAVVRRGAVAVVLAAAAAVMFWLSAPRSSSARQIPSATHRGDLLDLGMRDNVDPYELLDLGDRLGGSHAQ